MSEDTATTTAPQPESADLDQLWRRFSSDLRAFIARRVSRPQDADDILSIVFLRMAKSLDNLREQDPSWAGCMRSPETRSPTTTGRRHVAAS